MTRTILKRIDQSLNMARFYEVDIQQGLFGDVSVTRRWGRIGTRGQSKNQWVSCVDEADSLARRVIVQKKRRGYLEPPPCPALF